MARVESVAKAARILHAFDPERRTLTVRELAARSGCPRSTCHAICSTLVDEQLLERVPGGGYRLGPALAEMGGQVIERTGLVEAATPSMRGLSRAVGGEVHLGQLVGRFVIYLIRIEHERRLPMRNRMGLRAPAHLTGCGKAALAQLDPARVRSLLAGEPGVDMDRLLAELADARRTGYVVSDSFQRGVASVAAPLFGPGNTVVGGLSVAQPERALDAARRGRVQEAVREAAAQTSERLRTLPLGI